MMLIGAIISSRGSVNVIVIRVVVEAVVSVDTVTG